MNNRIIKCGDCYAHYPIGQLHICDPLMKALVTAKRKEGTLEQLDKLTIKKEDK